MRYAALALVIAQAALPLAGCASAHAMAAPESMLSRLHSDMDPQRRARIEESLTDNDLAALLDADVRAKLPTSLAVAKLHSRCSGYQPYLATIGAQELKGWQKALDGQSQVTTALPVTPLAAGGETADLKALRRAAARMNCELLLVSMQTDDQVDNYNDAAVLYWTVLGLWFVPGNVMEHRTVAQAVLLDVRTGTILGVAAGDNHLKRTYPLAFADQRRAELERETPPKATEDLQSAFAKLIGQVVTHSLAERR